jgi:hypothetical protein
MNSGLPMTYGRALTQLLKRRKKQCLQRKRKRRTS